MHATSQVEGHLRLARGFFKRGDTTAAVRELHAALGLEPENVEALYGLGTVRAARCEYEAARASLERAISLSPEMAVLHLTLGTVLAHTGRIEEARIAFRRVLDLDAGELCEDAKQRLLLLPDDCPAGTYTRSIEAAPPPLRSQLRRSAATVALSFAMIATGAVGRVEYDREAATPAPLTSRRASLAQRLEWHLVRGTRMLDELTVGRSTASARLR